MTQPPPYQGGYPPQQPQQPGQGQQPGYGQQQPGQGQQPGYGQQPQTPSGFPQAGGPGGPGMPPPPPPGGGFGGAAKSAGKGILFRIIGAVVVLIVLGVGAWVVQNFTGDPEVAAVGDCTNKSANTGIVGGDSDASDVKTVDCKSDEAFFEIVAREDSPSGTDTNAAGLAACQGTTATEFVYQPTKSGGIEWIICLDPIDLETAPYGELPGQAGTCFADNADNYWVIVDCTDPTATQEVVAAADSGLDAAAHDDDAVYAQAEQVCGSDGWEYYYTNQAEAGDDLLWLLCTKTPGA